MCSYNFVPCGKSLNGKQRCSRRWALPFRQKRFNRSILLEQPSSVFVAQNSSVSNLCKVFTSDKNLFDVPILHPTSQFAVLKALCYWLNGSIFGYYWLWKIYFDVILASSWSLIHGLDEIALQSVWNLFEPNLCSVSTYYE